LRGAAFFGARFAGALVGVPADGSVAGVSGAAMFVGGACLAAVFLVTLAVAVPEAEVVGVGFSGVAFAEVAFLEVAFLEVAFLAGGAPGGVCLARPAVRLAGPEVCLAGVAVCSAERAA
jgi:hypothetical protein